MHHVYHYLGMLAFWSTVGFAGGCAAMALLERGKRTAIVHEGRVVLDPFTPAQTRAIVLRQRAGVGRE